MMLSENTQVCRKPSRLIQIQCRVARFQGNCPVTVALEHRAAQSSSDLGVSCPLFPQAGRTAPGAFLQYLLALLPKGLWHHESGGGAGQHSLAQLRVFWWGFPRHFMTKNTGGCLLLQSQLLAQTYRTAQTLPACTPIISRALLLCTAVPFPGISPVPCTAAWKYLHRSPA